MAGARASGHEQAAWQLAPVPARVRGWLFALTWLLPVALVVVTLALVAGGGTNAAPPATGGPSLPWVVAAVAAFSGVVWILLDRAIRRHRIELDEQGLTVRTTFYTRTFAIEDLRIEQARNVVLAERPEYRPGLKTNGFALPGFTSGWFRLRGGERALVATVGGPRAIWLPTTRDHAVLLEPRQPQALLDRLQELAGTQARR